MDIIDCFFVGYNNVEMAKQRQLLRLTYGENSHHYRETNMSSKGYIKHNNRLFSSSELFNEFNKEHESVDNSFDDLSIHETFNLAIAYLGTYLNKRGHIIDYINSFNSEKELAKLLKQSKIRAIVIPTTFYIMTYPIVEFGSTRGCPQDSM